MKGKSKAIENVFGAIQPDCKCSPVGKIVIFKTKVPESVKMTRSFYFMDSGK